MLSTLHRHEPNVPWLVFDEIARITGIKSEWVPGGFVVPFCALVAVELEHEWCNFRAQRRAQWSAAVRDDLRNLAATLRSAEAQVRGLSDDARDFVSPDNAAALTLAAARFIHELEDVDARNRPRRGARPRHLREDELSGFYAFAAELIALIIEHGGRATCDKNLGTGTLVAALRLLRPHLPPNLPLPGFLSTSGSFEGLHRLDSVRREVIRRVLTTGR